MIRASFITFATIALALIALWQLVVWGTGAPPYMLPPPATVFACIADNWRLLFEHAVVTGGEILAGFVIGTLLGILAAMTMAASAITRRWLLPLLVISQALPVFAIAPLLVLWFGYGFAAKVAMAVLIIFFPVAAACFDGLGSTRPAWIDLARSMRARPHRLFLLIRWPAARPALASGLRVAAAAAPIGAVVGEWVGAGSGLGYLMLHAVGRVRTDLLFSALFVLCALALILYFTIDRLLKRWLWWQPNTLGTRGS